MKENINKIHKDILEIIEGSSTYYSEIGEYDHEICISKYDFKNEINEYFTKLLNDNIQ
jgi:hypothetical protein